MSTITSSPLLARIGQRIKEYRKAKKLTQKELAEKAQIKTSNHSYISLIENSYRHPKPFNPRILTLEALAAALDKKLEDLIKE